MAKANKKNNKTTKKSGFDAPVYGQVLKDNEKLVKQPNGNYKIVKK